MPVSFRELATIRKVRPLTPESVPPVGVAKGCKVLWFGTVVNLGYIFPESLYFLPRESCPSLTTNPNFDLVYLACS